LDTFAISFEEFFRYALSPSSAWGATDNSPRFQPWVSQKKIPKPRLGRQKKLRAKFFRPCGTWLVCFHRCRS